MRGKAWNDAGSETRMGRLIKYIFYLILIGFVALVGYAYIGPFFGVDFAPPPSEQHVPVDLDAK